jgi:signal transduction histidine kinase
VSLKRESESPRRARRRPSIVVRRLEVERRRSMRHAAVLQISRLILSRLSLDDLLHTVVEAIHDRLAYTHIALLLTDPDDGQTLVLRARGGVYVGVGEYRQHVEHGIIGAAARARRPVLVEDVREDPRYIPVPGAEQVRAELAAPILSGGRLLGVLNVETEHPLLADDVETISLLADQLGVAIENARLFETERRRAIRVAVTGRIGRLITGSLSLQVIFQTAAEAICEQLGYAYVAAGIVDEEDPEQLVLLAQAGSYSHGVPQGYRQSIHAGLVGVAARTRRSLLVNDVAKDGRYLPILEGGIRSELVVPIVAGDELLGLLNIESLEPIPEQDAADVEVIADQLAVAMTNARLYSRTRRALETTQLLYATSRRISTAMSVEALVAAYLEEVAARGRYICTVLIYELDETGQRAASTVRGIYSAESGIRLADYRRPYRRDPLDEWLDAGEMVTMSDVHGDPRASEGLRALQLRDGRPALAFIPLMVGGFRTGLVVLSYHQVYEWSEAELEPYRAAAALLAAAIASRQRELQVAEQRRQFAVLEERRRLARELHDSVTQSLFSMSLLAQVLPELWEMDRGEATAALHQIRDLTRGALAEMRALLFELRPAALGEQDIASALSEHVALFERRTGIAVAVTAEGSGRIPGPVEQALFRIAQEALANVARHAHARQVRLTLGLGPPTRLEIADDGAGFEPAEVGAERFGLVSMRERAGAIGAQLSIRSSVGQGTSIVVEWPGAAA